MKLTATGTENWERVSQKNAFLQTVRKRSPRYLDVSSGTF